MGGQAEALCSMLIHTQIDKAMIPACTADNYVLLGQASSVLGSDLKSDGPAKIYFDPRLSTDSFMPGPGMSRCSPCASALRVSYANSLASAQMPGRTCTTC